MKTIQEIRNILNHANGTEKYHRVSTIRNAPIATNGVVALAEAAECFWLLDAIISYSNDKRIPNPNFQVWKLTLTKDDDKKDAVLESLNDNKKVVIRQNIEFTDFPLDEITLWVVGGEPQGLNVIMLPSEY